MRLRLTVPMAEPLALSAGSYKVRVSRPGSLSETWKLELDRGYRQRFGLRLDERDLWPALTDLPNRVQVEPAGSDLVLIDPDGQTVRLIDGATGRPRWPRPAAFTAATVPKGRGPRTWGFLLHTGGPAAVPRTLNDSPTGPPSVVADSREIVFASTSSASLVALSRKDGSPLWWYHARPELPAGEKDARHSLESGTGTASEPLSMGGNTFVAAFRVLSDSYEVGQTRRSFLPQRWVDRVEFGAQRPAWRYLPPPEFGEDPILHLQRAKVAGKDALLFVVGPRLIALDTATGREVRAAIDLGYRPLHKPVLAEHAGEQLALLIGKKGTRERLFAFSLSRWLPAWEAELGYPPGASISPAARPPPAVFGGRVAARTWRVRHDGIGRFGVAAFDLAGGSRWDAPLGEAGVGDDRPDHLRLLAGPDLDGDGAADLLAAFVEKSARTKLNDRLLVYALSSAGGGPLWWWRPEGPESLNDLRLKQLLLWQMGAGGKPQLVVATKGNSGDFSYVLNTANGTLAHLLPGVADARAADLDGDGQPDLYYTHSEQSYRPGGNDFAEPDDKYTLTTAPRLRALRGLPFEPWRRLGAWGPVQDLDGDGAADVARVVVGPRGESRVSAASGRSGELLWPNREPKAGANPLAGDRVRVVSGRVFSPPLPWGDVDGDGYPDLFVLGTETIRARRELARLPLEIRSGQSGRPLPLTTDLAGPPQRLVLIDPRLTFLPGASPGGGLLVAAARRDMFHWTPQDGLGAVGLVALDAAAGRVARSGTLFQQRRDGDPHATELPLAAIDLGRGRPDLFAVVPTETAMEARAIDSATGDLLWSQTLRVKPQHAHRAWPPPAAGAFGGKPGVALLDANRVVLLDAATGKELRSVEVAGLNPLNPGALALATADFGGRGRDFVCAVLTSNGATRFVVIDSRDGVAKWGEMPFRQSDSEIAIADIDGDGRDEFVFAPDGRVYAARDDIARPLWTWPTDDADAAPDWALAEARLSAVVVVSAQRREARGLDGKTGKSMWRVPLPSRPGETSRVAVVFDADTSPRLVASRIGRDTICRISAAAKESAAPPEMSWPDPRLTRLLPWSDLQIDRPNVYRFLFPADFLALFVAPWVLVRRRRWWALAGWVGVLAVGYWLHVAYDLLDSRGVPWFVVPILLVMGAALGAVILAPPALGALWAWRRQWWRVAMLGGLFVGASLGVAGLFLALDASGSDDVYVTDGWSNVMVPGYLLTGLVLLMGGVGWRVGKRVALAAKRRRQRTKGIAHPSA